MKFSSLALRFGASGSTAARLVRSRLSRQRPAPEWAGDESLSDPEGWHDRVAEALPITKQQWDTVPYAGGVWAAAFEQPGCVKASAM
jgi:hypothetical protein